jgi:hypothetical protein
LKNEQRDFLQDFDNSKETLFNTRDEKENYEVHINAMNE